MFRGAGMSHRTSRPKLEIVSECCQEEKCELANWRTGRDDGEREEEGAGGGSRAQSADRAVEKGRVSDRSNS